jgi:hypothetical protein
MENFSKSIKLDDLKRFFLKRFLKDDLSLTIYVIIKYIMILLFLIEYFYFYFYFNIF